MSEETKSIRQDRKWDFSPRGLLKRYYRDLVVLVFFLFVYPQLTNESHFSLESKYMVPISIFWILMGIAGIVANVLKLGTLDSAIHEKKLQKEVKATACRFLAGGVALPLIFTLPIFVLVDQDNPPWWVGGIFIFLAFALLIVFLNVGKGSKDPAPKQSTVIISTVLLIFYELFVYTIFLESIFLGEGMGIQSFSVLFKLAIPMALLFCILFLPATIGFYIEATVRYQSVAVAFFVLLFRFIVFRYLPAFGIVALEQFGGRLPWVL